MFLHFHSADKFNFLKTWWMCKFMKIIPKLFTYVLTCILFTP